MSGKEHLILNEIQILKKVSKGHPNIITLHDYFETPNNLYLVMDLCTGGELFDRICERGFFYEEGAAYIVQILVDAVKYLHSQDIVHRDIKPENLLLKSKDSFEIVIADFGLSKLLNSEKMDGLRTTCGTPGYMPPEVIRKLGHGKPVDLWCIGVLTYFLLSGYMPFETERDNAAEETRNILAGKFDFNDEAWDDVSNEAKDFIKSLLKLNPSERLTAQQAFDHPWLQKSSSATLESPMKTESPLYNTPIAPDQPSTSGCGSGGSPTKDLLPELRDRFNARKGPVQKVLDVAKAIEKLVTHDDSLKTSPPPPLNLDHSSKSPASASQNPSMLNLSEGAPSSSSVSHQQKQSSTNSTSTTSNKPSSLNLKDISKKSD